MFERVSLPDLARVARRTVLSAIVVAVLAVGVCVLLDLPWVALGAVIGLGLGLLNFRMITASVVRVGKMPVRNKRRPLVLNTFSRLAFISVITLGLLFLNFGLGFGVLGGLAVFQMLLLANVARSMFVAGHEALGGVAGTPGGAAPLGGPLLGGTAGPPAQVIDTSAQRSAQRSAQPRGDH